MPDPEEMKPYTPEELKRFTEHLKKIPLEDMSLRNPGFINDNPFQGEQINDISEKINALEDRIKALEDKKRPSLIIRLEKSQVDAVLELINQTN